MLNVASRVHRLIDVPSNVQTSTLNISFTLASESKTVQVQVKTPDKQQQWIVAAEADEEGNYHLPPLSLGAGIDLPAGSYTMDVLHKDGQTLAESLAVTIPRTAVSDTVSYEQKTRTLTVRSPLAVVEAYDEEGSRIALEGDTVYEIPATIQRLLVGFPEEGLFFRIEP